MKKKPLDNKEIRIIRINETSVIEHLSNIIKKDICLFFDFPNDYKKRLHYYQQWDSAKQDFICFVCRNKNVEVGYIVNEVKSYTTNSMYTPNRWISLSIDNIGDVKHGRDHVYSKKTSTLRENECRVIRLNKAAVFELIYEDFIDNVYEYFDIPKRDYQYYWFWDDSTNDFIFFITKINNVDWDEVMNAVSTPTTESMNNPQKYTNLFVD